MCTYKKAPYKIFTLGPKFSWASLEPNNINFAITATTELENKIPPPTPPNWKNKKPPPN